MLFKSMSWLIGISNRMAGVARAVVVSERPAAGVLVSRFLVRNQISNTRPIANSIRGT